MADLMILTIGDSEGVQCGSLEVVKSKAINASVGLFTLEVIYAAGGPMATLSLDRLSKDWIALC